MGPRSGPSEAKQLAVLMFLQRSRTAHNIKELERSLPKEAGIASPQVKDFLQALLDDDRIRVEKIGSGNWYWSFASDIRASKQDLVNQLESEKISILQSITQMQNSVNEAIKNRQEQEDEEVLDNDYCLDSSDNENVDREMLQNMSPAERQQIKLNSLIKKQAEIRAEIESLNNVHDQSEYEELVKKVNDTRDSVLHDTDCIQAMESWIRSKASSLSYAEFTQLLKNWYGAEFCEEDGGLKEVF